MSKTETNRAPFSYDGLDRVIHEKARLGLADLADGASQGVWRSPISSSSAG